MRRPDMTESPSTGSGGSLPSFVVTDFLYIERSCARIILQHNLHLLSIHIFQQLQHVYIESGRLVMVKISSNGVPTRPITRLF